MTTPSFRLDGKKALVTGASRGIGLAIAQGLAESGASVALTTRKAEGPAADALESACLALVAKGHNPLTATFNQGDPASVEKLFAFLDAVGFVPDILVLNAATNPVMGPLVDTDLSAWQKILDVNLTGAFLTAQHALRRMAAKKAGSIIFISSIAGIDPLPGLGAYSVSKAGLLGLMRALAKEVGPEGIRVNAVAPGLIETRFSAALFADAALYQQFIRQTPLGRHGQADDVVGAVLFLASEAAGYVNGQTLVVDGGGRV